VDPVFNPTRKCYTTESSADSDSVNTMKLYVRERHDNDGNGQWAMQRSLNMEKRPRKELEHDRNTNHTRNCLKASSSRK